MTTLRALVGRADLNLRFLTAADEQRYGDRQVNGAVQPDLPLDELCRRSELVSDNGPLRAFLVLLSPAIEDEFLGLLADLGVAGVVLRSNWKSGDPPPAPWAAAARRHGLPLLVMPDDGIWASAAINVAILDERRHEDHHTSHFLRDLQREAARPEGLARLLELVAKLVGGYAVLVDRSGHPESDHSRVPDGLLTQVADDIRRVAAGRISSASVSLRGAAVHVLPIDSVDPPVVLVVGRRSSFTPAERRLVADAARLIGMRRRLDELARTQQRVGEVDLQNREVVLHLLMTGHLPAARRAASALRPELADVIRVHLVEGPKETRDQLVSRCVEATDDQAWIIRCPLYSNHVIVLAPVLLPPPYHDDKDGMPLDRLSRALRELVPLHDDVSVGASLPVSLADTPVGWGQAYHALAVARNSAERFARFNPQASIADLLGPDGDQWARAKLRPLLHYRPDRPQDPDAGELTETLRSWLTFSSSAARLLKIHRNTLSSRLRRIESLLGCELADLVTQTELNLAMQLLGTSDEQERPTDITLNGLLDHDHVREWADDQLRPFFQRESLLLLDTLRCWLDNNASLKAAATRLGISVPGVRKRLLRVEELTERSLLGAPSVRYDLWIALRVHDRSHP
ncbi:hypothetical protein GCM10022254_02200 [Actinomadura meridiana]|uniref:PucR C-terminal helix-turn-helix domain-containing protein n=1 Tax=Actinomadura meridiana TaxID=559626 RepID=A0ABP8BRP5_9ACTN